MLPKASPECVAQGLFDGLESGEEGIFQDPASQSIAEGRRSCCGKNQPPTKEINAKKQVMKKQDFATSFTVDQSPEEVSGASSSRVFNSYPKDGATWSFGSADTAGSIGLENLNQWKAAIV